MLGSSLSISGPNFILNTIVAEALEEFADKLEKSKNFTADLNALIKETLSAHQRIIFNGNGYDESWLAEAEKRGLSNLKTTPEALGAMLTPENISLFTKHAVYTETELRSRHEIFLESYAKTINIEALTLIDLVNREVIPAVVAYQNELAALVNLKKQLSEDCADSLEAKLLTKLSKLGNCLEKRLTALSEQTVAVHGIEDSEQAAAAYRERVFSGMGELRAAVDELELIVAKKYWTLPTYAEILYSVI
jgi:glutamine synthetase